MLESIYVRQSTEENHPELYYAYLKWNNNWCHPGFSTCGIGPEEALQLLYNKLKKPENLSRIRKTWDEVMELKVFPYDNNSEHY